MSKDWWINVVWATSIHVWAVSDPIHGWSTWLTIWRIPKSINPAWPDDKIEDLQILKMVIWLGLILIVIWLNQIFIKLRNCFGYFWLIRRGCCVQSFILSFPIKVTIKSSNPHLWTTAMPIPMCLQNATCVLFSNQILKGLCPKKHTVQHSTTSKYCSKCSSSKPHLKPWPRTLNPKWFCLKIVYPQTQMLFLIVSLEHVSWGYTPFSDTFKNHMHGEYPTIVPCFFPISRWFSTSYPIQVAMFKAHPWTISSWPEISHEISAWYPTYIPTILVWFDMTMSG